MKFKGLYCFSTTKSYLHAQFCCEAFHKEVLLAGQVETCRSTGTAGYRTGNLLLGAGFKTAGNENINSADI